MRMNAGHVHQPRISRPARLKTGSQFPTLSGFGLGQDDSGDDDSGDVDLTGLQNLPSSNVLLPISPTITSGGTDSLGFDLSTPTASSGSDDALTQSILSASNNGSSSVSASQLSSILTAAGYSAAAVAKAINSTGSPYVIPGTSLVYNPATGQISGSTAVSTAVAGGISSLTSMLPLIVLAIVGGFLLESMSGGKR